MITGIASQSDQSGLGQLANIVSTNTTLSHLLSTSAFTNSVISDTFTSLPPPPAIIPGSPSSSIAAPSAHNASSVSLLSANDQQPVLATPGHPSPPAHIKTSPTPPQPTFSTSMIDVDPPSASLPFHHLASSQTGTSISSGNSGKCKQNAADNHPLECPPDSSAKVPATLSAFVGMTGAVGGLMMSLNQSLSQSDIVIVQWATTLVAKASFLQDDDKGLLVNYYSQNPTAVAGILSLDESTLQISLLSCIKLIQDKMIVL